MRAVQVSPSSMWSVSRLFSWLPDLHVIYRRNNKHCQLTHSPDHSNKTRKMQSIRPISNRGNQATQVTCHEADDTVRWKRQLEQQFPRQLFTLNDDLVSDSIARTYVIRRVSLNLADHPCTYTHSNRYAAKNRYLSTLFVLNLTNPWTTILGHLSYRLHT